MDNKDVELLKEVEQSRRNEKDFRRKQQKNEEFEEASQGAYFTVFNSITGALTAVVSIVVVELVLWNTSKWLFGVATVVILLSIILRMISKYYYMKNQQKKFEVFNKLYKATGVIGSVTDVTVLKGSKAASSSSKAESAQDKVTDVITTIAELQFNGGVYIDQKYDTIRDRCYRTGKYIHDTQTSSYEQLMVTDVFKDTRLAKMSKGSSSIVKMFALYVNDYISDNYPDAEDDLFFSCLGALHFYKFPLRELSNTVPLVGYKDNTFSIYCVYAANKKRLDTYFDWKTAKLRAASINQYAENVDSIWELLRSVGNNSVTDKFCVHDAMEAIEKDEQISKDMLPVVRNIFRMLYYWFEEHYYDIPDEQFQGICGLVDYVGLDKKLTRGPITQADGYLDKDVLIRCCEIKCKDLLDNFTQWYTLYQLYEENDSLTQYLRSTVGGTPEDMEREIKRLARLCDDDSITNLRERATYTVQKQFHINPATPYVPTDLHDWAVAKELTDKQALKLIYTYIPEALKSEMDDIPKLAVKYWNNYKDILTA